MSVIACHFCDRILYACGRSPLVILFALVAALVGCPWDGVDPRPVFAVSIAPHGYLLERIGGDKIRVAVLVPTGKEPESYQPRPGDMTALSRAKALFCTGMPFEAALIPKLKSVAPDLKCLDLREGLALRALELHSHAEGTGATELVHSASCAHDGLDPHIWFAPGMLKRQADAVLSVLIEYAPENADDFRRNHEELVAELESLHAELAEKLAPFRGRTVFVFHPSYGYFCDEFGLRQNAIEFEGKSPKPQQLAQLIAETKAETQKTGRLPVIFVQPEFNRASADAIAEATGGKTVKHSCLDRDLLRSIRRFGDEFVKSQE